MNTTIIRGTVKEKRAIRSKSYNSNYISPRNDLHYTIVMEAGEMYNVNRDFGPKLFAGNQVILLVTGKNWICEFYNETSKETSQPSPFKIYRFLVLFLVTAGIVIPLLVKYGFKQLAVSAGGGIFLISFLLAFFSEWSAYRFLNKRHVKFRSDIGK